MHYTVGSKLTVEKHVIKHLGLYCRRSAGLPEDQGEPAAQVGGEGAQRDPELCRGGPEPRAASHVLAERLDPRRHHGHPHHTES